MSERKRNWEEGMWTYEWHAHTWLKLAVPTPPKAPRDQSIAKLTRSSDREFSAQSWVAEREVCHVVSCSRRREMQMIELFLRCRGYRWSDSSFMVGFVLPTWLLCWFSFSTFHQSHYRLKKVFTTKSDLIDVQHTFLHNSARIYDTTLRRNWVFTICLCP